MDRVLPLYVWNAELDFGASKRIEKSDSIAEFYTATVKVSPVRSTER